MQNVQFSTGRKESQSNPECKCIILDIDNTIVHAVNPKLVHPDWVKKFNTVTSSGPIDYCIFLRPGLEDFLEYIFSNYTVGVFSAGDSEYVNFVIKNIIQTKSGRNLHFVMSNKEFETCKFETGDLKSISWVNQKYPMFTVENTLIIDDYFLVKVSNPKNTYLIDKFEVCTEVKSNIEINQIINADNKYILLEKLYIPKCENDLALSKFIHSRSAYTS